MPFIQVKILEGLYTEAQKGEIIQKITDAMTSIKGENLRPITWVLIEEIKSGDWGMGGKCLTASEVRALSSGKKLTWALKET
jgi:4-oxalocrotonate tautomerase